MKQVPSIILFTCLLIFVSWDNIILHFGPQPDLSKIQSNDILLYSTSWCGYCAKMRRFLDSKDIPYFEIDIEKSAEGRQLYNALGGKGIPLTVVKGKPIQGYNPGAVLKALSLP